MSHASMLKARRQHQKNKKRIDGEAKLAKRLAREALAGPKKEKVKKEKVKKEKVKKEKVATEKVKKEKVESQNVPKKEKGGAGGGKKEAS